MANGMKDKKTGITIFLFAVLFFTANIAWSHDSHQNTSVTNVSRGISGVAAGIAASQCNHDFATTSLQGCVGAGTFKDNTAITFGLAKRFDKILVNGSITTENGETGIGAGINFRF